MGEFSKYAIVLTLVLTLALSGCATLLGPPIMAVTTPVSCTAKIVEINSSPPRIVVAVLAVPLEMAVGIVFGLFGGMVTDVSAFADGKYTFVYEQAMDSAVNPCRDQR